jgi:nucleobase:cation symporter-1, NCS1 family
MTDEPVDQGSPQGPRRRTYEPPSEEAVFAGSFPVADDTVLPPTSAPRNIPEPPVRTSLSEIVILEQFQGPSAGSTADLIQELERQVFLKEEEEEAFASWAQIVRHLRGVEAEPYIARQRIIFDGGDPGPEDQSVSDPEANHGADPAADSVSEEPIAETEARDDPPEDDSATDPSLSETFVDTEDSAELAAETLDPAVTEDTKGLDTTDRWPMPQAESHQEVSLPREVAPSGFAMSMPAAVASWWGVGVPLAAVIAGAYLSSKGMGILESVVVLGSLALVVGIMVGVMAQQGFRRGYSTQDLLGGTFGRAGAIAPALVLAVVQLVAVTFLLWWAAELLVTIVSAAGLWPYEAWIAYAGAWALLIGLTAVLTLVGPRVLQGALFVGSGAAVLGLGLVLIQGLPAFSPSLEWSWSAPWMTVVSAGSLMLALSTLVVVFVAADLATLRSGSTSRWGGVVAALVLVIPCAVLAGVSSWLAQGSADISLGLLTDPVGTLTDGAPAFYPTFAIIAAVIPVASVAALLTRSLGLSGMTLRVPGSSRAHAGVVIVLLAVAATLVQIFALRLSDYLVDLGLTLGVFGAALAAILAKEWALLGRHKPADTPPLRILPLLALVFPVALGLGLLESSVPWLAWQGYLFPALEMAGVINLAPAAPGVLVAFVLAGVISGLGALVEWARYRKSVDVTKS